MRRHKQSIRHEETPAHLQAGVLSLLHGTTLDELTGKPDRRRILALNGGRCIYCNRRSADTIDHIYPQDCRKAFVSQPFNLAPSCGRCNLRKGHQHWLGYFRNHPDYCPEREFWIEDRLRAGIAAFEAQQREECGWQMPGEYRAIA